VHEFSVVIPSYNMGWALPAVLRALNAQQCARHAPLEVIVSDDGSTDATGATVARLVLPNLRLIHLFQPRDEGSGRSRARNAGLARATGDWIVLLDSTVLLDPLFLSSLLTGVADDTAIVLAEVHGVGATSPPSGMSEIDECSPELIADLAGALAADIAWCDRRRPIFDACNGDLTKLQAPWLLAWSAVLAVSRRWLQKAGAFDESLRLWGGEDVEWAYRLFQAGGRFQVFRQRYALHWPHQTASWDARLSEQRVNFEAIHKKHMTLETEVLRYTNPFLALVWMERLKSLFAGYLLPSYEEEPLTFLVDQCASGRSLLCLAHRRLAERLPTSHVLCGAHGLAETLAGIFPERHVRPLIGACTDWDAGSFEVAVVNDFLGFLPRELAVAILIELRRISRRVLLLTRDMLENEPRNNLHRWGGWQPETNGLTELIDEAECVALPVVRSGNDVVFELTSRARA
jgi:glycosyltransferase involved in cell wall biosynthesis